ncbi:MAG: hypothetical protein ACI4ND_05610 [Succinivibrio sp.]
MSKKSIEKKIRLKKAMKAVKNATPYKYTLSLLESFEGSMLLATIVGLSIAEILKSIDENKAPKDSSFTNFVAYICEYRQRALFNFYAGQTTSEPYPIISLIIAVMQILDNADLLTGIKAQLVPTIEKGKLTIDIKTDPKNISLLEQGKEYIKSADSICSLFTAPEDYGQKFAELAYSKVVYILDKLPKD